MFPAKVQPQIAQVLCFMALFVVGALPVQAQTTTLAEALPVVSQLSGSAGILLPGKAWQNIQIGQTLPVGSQILTSVSGLQLSFLKTKIALSPFCHLIIKGRKAGKESLLLVVQAGQVFLTGNPKQVSILFSDTSEQPQNRLQPQTDNFAQTYRVLSPWMGL